MLCCEIELHKYATDTDWQYKCKCRTIKKNNNNIFKIITRIKRYL